MEDLTMLYPLNVQVQLDKIHCYDEADFIGNASPYLWAVFFKIDGDSTFINDNYHLEGTTREVFTNLGDHGNLMTNDVGAGEDVAIPQQFRLRTTLTPIPLNRPIGQLTHLGGVLGCAVILLEEDNTSDTAVAAGHAAFLIAVKDALHELIPTLEYGHEAPTEEELVDIQNKVTSAIESAIADNTRILGWIYAGGNMDDKLGSKVFYFSRQELLDFGPGGRSFTQRWNDEGQGDWEIYGQAKINWSDWRDLGGILTSAPAAASWQENRLDCFVRGTDMHLWHKWWGGSGWSQWEDLGAPQGTPDLQLAPNPNGPVGWPMGITSAPAVVSWGPNRIDCFARGLNGHMWHKWWNGSAWSEWEDLGGVLTSAPAVASWNENRLDCFVRGADMHMWHKWWDGSAWSEWEDLGGILTSAPAAVSWGNNRIDCFVRGTNSHMFHKWWDGSAWSEWEDLGGGLSGAPAVASRKENSLDCFVRGTDNQMWFKGWDGSNWSEWKPLGGILTDAPGAVAWGPNRVDCFVKGTNNRMWHKWWGDYITASPLPPVVSEPLNNVNEVVFT